MREPEHIGDKIIGSLAVLVIIGLWYAVKFLLSFL
jgi:hypothetical protein